MIGAYGKVTKVIKNNKLVACKTFHPNSLVSSECVTIEDFPFYSIVREFDSLSVLQGYPHIVQCTEISLDNLHPRIYMESATEDMDMYLRRTGLIRDVNLVRNIVAQIVIGLAYAYIQGIVHRDLKPSNILVFDEEDEKVFKVGDWGNSSCIWRINHEESCAFDITTSTATSLDYRAPEVFLGSKNHLKIDVWSLGIIVCQMLSNKILCYNTKTEKEQLIKWCQLRGTPTEETWPGVTSLPNYEIIKYEKQHAERKLNINGVDSSILEFINDCLTFSPHQRPTIPMLLHHPFIATVCEQKLWNIRKTLQPLPSLTSDFLPHRYEGISHEMREIVVSWLLEVTNDCQTTLASFIIGVGILDQILHQPFELFRPSMDNLQLLASASFYIASTFVEVNPKIYLKDMCYLSDGLFTCYQLQNTICYILETFNGRISTSSKWIPSCLSTSLLMRSITENKNDQKTTDLQRFICWSIITKCSFCVNVEEQTNSFKTYSFKIINKNKPIRKKVTIDAIDTAMNLL